MKWARGGTTKSFRLSLPTLCLYSKKFQEAEERQVCVSLCANGGDNVHHASFFIVANELPDVVHDHFPPRLAIKRRSNILATILFRSRKRGRAKTSNFQPRRRFRAKKKCGLGGAQHRICRQKGGSNWVAGGRQRCTRYLSRQTSWPQGTLLSAPLERNKL